MAEEAKDGSLARKVKKLEEKVEGLREMERSLRKSESRFRAIFDQSFQFASILDTNGLVIEMNDLCREVCGEFADDVVGGFLWEAGWWAQFPHIQDSTRRAIQRASRGEIVSDEAIFLDKDKCVRQCVRIFSPIKERSGSVSLISSVGLDISERVRAEKLLRESEEKFRFFTENIADIVWTLDLNLNTTYVSPSIERILGFTPEERVLQTTEEMLTPESLQKVQAVLLEELQCEREGTVDPKRSVTVEAECYHKDGSTLWLENIVRAIRDSSGSMVGILGVSRDLTERKRAEEMLREANKDLSQIFNISVPMCIIDTNYTMFRINESFAKFLGMQADRVIGQKCYEVWNAPLCHTPQCQLRRVLRGEQSVEYEVTKNLPNGTSVSCIVTAAPYRNARGELSGILSNFIDITKRKQLEEELRQSQKMEAIGTLAGGIAHDFNNILGIVLGNAELAMAGIPEWSPVRENLEKAKTGCLRARDVVRQLLTFSRRGEMSMKPMLVAPLVKEGIGFIRSSMPAIIQIRQNIDDDAGPICADATQVNQVFINLCTNAAYSMQEGGGVLEVDLKNVNVDENSAGDYAGAPVGDYVELFVKDTGKGIASEDMERIFDPYFTTRAAGSGTGLGLAVVKGIVDRHGGRILVESAPGKGATFRVLFPRVEEEVPPEIEEVESIPKGHERILFVDDEEFLVSLGRELLEMLGYEVVACTSCLVALRHFEGDPEGFDLVITDMTMPELTGDMFSRRLLSVRPDTPIILCTGYSEHITPEEAERMGIRAFVTKPFTVEDLAQAVRHALDGK